jgi:CBS domain-containing protein
MPLNARVLRPARLAKPAAARCAQPVTPAPSLLGCPFVSGPATRRVPLHLPSTHPAPRKTLAPLRSTVSPDGTYDVDKLDVDTLDVSDPYGVVGDVMTTENLRCVGPEDPLTAAAEKLDKITGLAVVDGDNVVVGVVSIKVRMT